MRRALTSIPSLYARSSAGCLRPTQRTFISFNRRLPFNTVAMFVPQQEAWIVQRFGKYKRTLDPGLNFIFPFIDSISYVQSLKEIAIEVPDQAAITIDNVVLKLNAVLYVRVTDPYAASYGVEDVEFAITQLAQTTMRSELGKISLDSVFKERDSLNLSIVDSLNNAAQPWGLRCLRYEIRDIDLPEAIRVAMQMQVEAERKKRAAVLESEGARAAEINFAEGHKRSKILASEADKTEKVNRANGEAEALRLVSEARAQAIRNVAAALGEENGKSSVSMTMAQHYIDAFGKLAESSNTMILPSQAGDVSSMVAQAMAIYKKVDAADLGAAVDVKETPTKA